jgi:hypothetical protein
MLPSFVFTIILCSFLFIVFFLLLSFFFIQFFLPFSFISFFPSFFCSFILRPSISFLSPFWKAFIHYVSVR